MGARTQHQEPDWVIASRNAARRSNTLCMDAAAREPSPSPLPRVPSLSHGFAAGEGKEAENSTHYSLARAPEAQAGEGRVRAFQDPLFACQVWKASM